MNFKTSLISGTLIKRYKRFLCDVQLENGEIVTAHCANSGSLMGVRDPGLKVWLSSLPASPKTVLRYRWELVEKDNTFIGVNTLFPNALVEEALAKEKILPLQGYESVRREVTCAPRTRMDFFLEGSGRPGCFLEVKSVHMKIQNMAQFPDAVTQRGAKHLHALMALKDQGYRVALIYVVQRPDCETFTLATSIDPHYARVAQEAYTKGVEFFCYGCHITLKEITLEKALTIVPPTPDKE